MPNSLAQFIGFSVTTKQDQIILICKVSLLVCVSISSSLWFPVHNHFPSLPVFASFSELPNPVFYFFSGISVLLLIAAILLKWKKTLIIAFLVFFLLTSLLNRMMWQPWSYYYSMMLLSMVVLWNKQDQLSLHTIRLILAFIYIFSGLQKFNAGFALETYPWLIEPITQYFGEESTFLLNNTFLIAPIVEFLAGKGLLFNRTQILSKWILVGMHLFILAMIGPFGQNANAVVWPWNISFILLLTILFRKDSDFSISEFLKLKIGFYKYLIVFLFTILPVTSVFNWWPLHFSSALYSGNKIRSEVFLPVSLTETFPESIQSKFSEFENGITLNSWSQAELKVAMIPEKEAHLIFFQKVCEQFPEYWQEILITIKDRPDIFSGERTETTLFCDDISHE